MTAISSSSAWLRGVVHLFESQGVDAASLFEEAGLDPGSLKRPHTRFATADVSRLWEIAVRRSGQDALGLDRQLARKYVDFDVAAQAMWPNTSLGGGLESFSRYLLLIGDAAGFTVVSERSDRWLVHAHSMDTAMPRQRIEFGMLALLLLCQRATRRPLRPLAADFVHPEPADLHAHRMAFHCPLRFGQPANRLRIAADDLALPIAAATESVFAFHERVIEGRLARMANARTSYRAGEEIIRRLHLGQPLRPDVARSLGLADGALEQRLRAEGTSFDDLLDDVRKELAAHYLANPAYPLARVAGLLGWRSAAELGDACRRWWGMQPSQYRQRRVAEGAPS